MDTAAYNNPCCSYESSRRQRLHPGPPRGARAVLGCLARQAAIERAGSGPYHDSYGPAGLVYLDCLGVQSIHVCRLAGENAMTGFN